MVTQSSDPTALSKITDGLHTNVIPATVKQDSRMFFPSSVVMSLGLKAILFLMYFTFKFIFRFQCFHFIYFTAGQILILAKTSTSTRTFYRRSLLQQQRLLLHIFLKIVQIFHNISSNLPMLKGAAKVLEDIKQSLCQSRCSEWTPLLLERCL